MDFCGRLQRWPQQVRRPVDVDSRLGAHTRLSTVQETDGFRAALKPFDSSCSLRVLSESDKDRPRKSAFPGRGVLWWRRAMEEALVEEVQAPGGGETASVPSALPATSPCSGGSGASTPPAVRVSSEAKPEKEARTPESGRARSGDRQKGSCSGQEVEFTIGQERSSESKWEPNRRAGQRREAVAHEPFG